MLVALEPKSKAVDRAPCSHPSQAAAQACVSASETKSWTLVSWPTVGLWFFLY